MDDEEYSKVLLESLRFWIQRVLVPIVVFVGVVGNVVTVMVLTRKRMRSSTNVYLTALAVADIVHLFFVLMLSFQHYPNIKDKKFELYWRFYGISHWLCDAGSSTSIWLTVSFTLERYLVVCHPIKGKVLCTENRAKCIIAIIAVLCLMSTASTPFEHQLTTSDKCIQEVCNQTDIKDVKNHLIEVGNLRVETNLFPNITEDKIAENVTIEEASNATCCIKTHTIGTEPTSLGNHVVYKTIFYWFSSIVFGILPIILIATFNCFLVAAVYRSQRRRKRLTNSQEKVSQKQENRITILLIGVVVLFLICQTPTASYLIYTPLYKPPDEYTENIIKGLGNVFNFLLCVNAACNFLLYCVLSEKYRRTFRTLFCERNLKRQDTFSITRSRTCRTDSTKNSDLFKRTATYGHTPRNLEAQSLNSIPRTKSLMNRPLGKARSTDLHV